MIIYVIGSLVAFLLCAYLHYIEVKHGIEKDWFVDFIVTTLLCVFSWVGVIICSLGVLHYHVSRE